MAAHNRAPVIQQDTKEIARLVSSLQSAAGKSKGKGSYKCRKNEYLVRGTDNVFVDSWKFMDWDYKRDDLPTYARGLFTLKNRDKDYEIAARGYDKFFNIDEVNDTKWATIEKYTRGPYELSVKENGCIIFVSGLEDDVLLVCSKHSTGGRGDPEKAHSIWGERWIDRSLAAVGRTREDLARELRDNNITAIAELCDDKFEEHVLAYDEKAAGLYVHGINVNIPEFATWSSSKVHEFADKWGFKKAQYLIKDDIHDVRKFLEKCAETGSYEGQDTEGFVIRCQKSVGGSGGPCEDWFFKYKFEEPYLMYRQWREATKAVIANRVPRYKKHKTITDEYLIFARRQFAQNPGLAKAYNQNHGIIKMREDFLRVRGLKGSEIIQMEEQDETSPKNAASNFILVPIATIGCGKTTVAVALTKLFGWGHVQNDNIQGKANRPKQFATLVTGKLLEHPAVIADRNNHQKRERTQLFDDITPIVRDAKFVALHYVHEPKDEMYPDIRRATRHRVVDRGDNHQTIHAGSKSEEEIVGIMEGFLKRFEPLDTHSNPDDGFDEVIELDVVADSRHNLETVVTALHKAFPKLVPEMPSSDAMDDAIAYALNDYSPALKHELSFNTKGKGNRDKDKGRSDAAPMPKTKSKEPRVEYFSMQLPSAPILKALDAAFGNADAATAMFYRHLMTLRRVKASFHVTLVHSSAKNAQAGLWAALTDRWHAARSESLSEGVLDVSLGVADVTLPRIVWDDRIMCLTAVIEDATWAARCSNDVPHVTVGTAANNIKPRESNDLLAALENRGGPGGKINVLDLPSGGVKVVGDVRAITALNRPD